MGACGFVAVQLRTVYYHVLGCVFFWCGFLFNESPPKKVDEDYEAFSDLREKRKKTYRPVF